MIQISTRLLCLKALSLLLIFSVPLLSIAQCPQLVWADEFSGSSLDQTKWTPQIGNGCDIGICGWGNNELQYYTDKSTNLQVANGNLVITARKERVQSNQYTSARIRTINKGDWKYGRMEARMKLPIGQGLWPAFWMLSTDEVYGGWPQSGEIDIMENKGSEPNITYGTIHYGDPYPNNKHTGGKYLLPNGRFTDDFHVFAIEWEPDQIRWYLDGILFATKTAADVAPYRWPFDQRFHILLNLAVGGNFGGDPDATTTFPQSLTVDYVRVYGSKFPYISGPDQVNANQTAITYAVPAQTGASYTWSVPADAVIKAGQGTSSITVDWGTSQGQVKVVINQTCGNKEYFKNVYIKPTISYGFTLENFDDKRNLTYLSSNGVYEQAIANISPSGVNTSAKVGKYTRNSSAQYDVLYYATTQITDASQYSSRKKKFFLDVYTAAPVGTLIFIQLENSATATGSNFPTGRHSRYVAYTSKQNQWERLEFDLDAVLDASVPAGSVDRLLILYASNSFTGDVYYMDNLDSYDVGTASSSDTQAPSAPANLIASSKTDVSVSLSWTASTDNVGVTGYEVFTNGASLGTTTATTYTVTGLIPNTSYTFTVKAKDAAGNISTASNALTITTNAAASTSIKVEAENYTTAKGVTTQSCQDAGGGLNVTSIDNRDYMDYTVNIPTAGTYRIDFRVASSVATGKFDFKKGSTILASLSVPNTGGGQQWQTINSQVNLAAGTQTFRVAATATGFNLNWLFFELVPAAQTIQYQAKVADVEIPLQSGVQVYPNPAQGSFSVTTKDRIIIDEISVASTAGTQFRIYPKSSTVTIDMSRYAKGVYFIEIRQGNIKSKQKLVLY
jgi:beta-glucanase (GH16 family)